ncbi:MAG: hypothetical protein ABFE07_25725, partial [Armatimonadia bacterium]
GIGAHGPADGAGDKVADYLVIAPEQAADFAMQQGGCAAHSLIGFVLSLSDEGGEPGGEGPA